MCYTQLPLPSNVWYLTFKEHRARFFNFSVLVKEVIKTTGLTSSEVPLCRQKSSSYWINIFKRKLAKEVYFIDMLL